MLVAAVSPAGVVLLVWLFALGCAVGSFLNVVIYRMPRGLSVGRPRRSFCPACGAGIAWYDNVPLVSFLLLRGRCRQCGGAISWRYPLVEALTGALFALLAWRQAIAAAADPGHVVVMLLVVALLIAGSAIDMEWLIIPDEVNCFGMLGGLLAGALLPGLHIGTAPWHTAQRLTGMAHLDGLLCALIGLVAGGVLVAGFAIVGAVIFRKEAMGFGDVKLMAMLGAFFGWKFVVVTFFVAPFVGLLYGLPLLVLKDEHVMPYGPFLSIGAVVALLFRGELTAYLEPFEQLWSIIF